jgi:ell wall binding domain 2 (CWB2)/GlcNAc-PI de-N-acetylase
VVGGVSSVSEAVVSAIQAATGATVIRHAGADRYAVSAGLATSLWPDGASTVYLAGGSTFADGLAATPAAAAAGAPLVLSAATCMPDATVDGITTLGASKEVYVGGPATLTTAHQACSTPVSQQNAVYVVPHQGDVLISMVGGITADISAGRDVWVVKINRGDYTAVYDQLCSKYGYCLTREQFGAARDREFVESAVAMGVRSDHVILNSVIEQDPGYAPKVDALMEGLVQRFGRDTFFSSISFLDLHPSHAPVGYALKYRCESELVSRCTFFQSPLYQPGSAIAENPVTAPAPTWVAASSSVVMNAVAAYKKWDPANGRYAIGWKSVQTQLTHTMSHPGSLLHRDSRYYSEAQRAAAQSWIDANQDPAWWTFANPPTT